MMRLNVRLRGQDAVRRFVGITSRYGADMELASGNYSVDAKSILGIFSMDLNKPIELRVSEEIDSLRHELKDFIAA